ncbi:MAG: BatA and WFA domain-containing protein [Sandaracinaceae bacterium]
MFVRPYMLFGLLLLVPVIAAFLFRHPRHTAVVPSTLLFQSVAHKLLKNRKLRDLLHRLAAVLCIAGVAALVLAAADPRGAGPTRTTVVVVDVSSSMEGAAFDEAMQAARTFVRQRGAHEHVALLAAGRTPRHLAGPTLDSVSLEAGLSALSLEQAPSDALGTLRLADGLLEHRRRGRIVWITDGGRNHLEQTPETTRPLEVVRVGGTRHNVGLTVAAAQPSPRRETDLDRDLLVVAAASSGPAREVDLVLSADGVELERQPVTIEGGHTVESTFALRVPAERVSVHLEVTDGGGNALPQDDRAELSLVSGRVPRVLLIAAEDAPARFFVEHALRASGVHSVKTRLPSEAPLRLADGEVAVVLGEGPATAIDGPALYLGTVQGAMPVRVAAQLDDVAETELRSIEPDHALTRGVSLDDAHILRAVAVHVPAGAESVAELVGGAVLVRGGAGRQRWIYGGFDPARSDLVLRVAFPVLMANALADLSGACDVQVAHTLSRSEITLAPSAMLADLDVAAPETPLPLSWGVLLAMLGAVLLASEGIAFQRGWTR